MNANERADIHNGIAWAIIFALAGIIMGVIALATVCPRTDLSIDYMGVIVGILSLLVTTLIGWQIFNLIKIDKLRESLESSEKRIAEVKNEAQKDLYLHTSLMMAIHSKNSISKFDLNAVSKDYNSVSFAYSMAASALRYSLECDLATLTDGCLSTMAICIRIANTFNAWDSIFTKETTELAEKTYRPIIARTALLTEKQVNNLEQIHYCRKNRQTHPSLRNI